MYCCGPKLEPPACPAPRPTIGLQAGRLVGPTPEQFLAYDVLLSGAAHLPLSTTESIFPLQLFRYPANCPVGRPDVPMLQTIAAPYSASLLVSNRAARLPGQRGGVKGHPCPPYPGAVKSDFAWCFDYKVLLVTLIMQQKIRFDLMRAENDLGKISTAKAPWPPPPPRCKLG